MNWRLKLSYLHQIFHIISQQLGSHFCGLKHFFLAPSLWKLDFCSYHPDLYLNKWWIFIDIGNVLLEKMSPLDLGMLAYRNASIRVILNTSNERKLAQARNKQQRKIIDRLTGQPRMWCYYKLVKLLPDWVIWTQVSCCKASTRWARIPPSMWQKTSRKILPWKTWCIRVFRSWPFVEKD